jgi:hypothetical protein
MVDTNTNTMLAADTKAKKKLRTKLATKDEATRALAYMTGSKVAMAQPEPITVVEPASLELYKRPVHEALAKASPKTPAEWKGHVFTKILDEELKGGEFRYNSDSLEPIAIMDD